MEFSIKSGNPEKQRSDCLIVGVYESRKLSSSAEALDAASGGFLTTVLKRGDLDGKAGSTLLLHSVPGLLSERVLLVGLGKERELDEKHYRQAVKAAVKAINSCGASDAVSFLADLSIKKQDIAWRVAQHAEVVLDAVYKFDCMKGKAAKEKKADAPKGIKKLTINVVSRADIKPAEAGLKQGQAIGAGVRLAKDLGNLPPNVCTPTYLAEQAKALSKSHGLEVQVLDRPEMEKLGMGSFLGVAQGSR